MISPNVANALDQVEVYAIISLGTVLVGAAAALAAKGYALLQQKLHIVADSKTAQVFENAITNGLNKGAMIVGARLAQGDPSVAGNPRQAMIDIANDYVEPKVQAEIKQLGIDPATLRERIEARVTPYDETKITDALNSAERVKAAAQTARPQGDQS